MIRTEADILGLPRGASVHEILAARESIVDPIRPVDVIDQETETARIEWRRSGRRRFTQNPDAEGWIDSDAVLQAYVNDNRWVADCPCGNGLPCTPGIDHAACIECARVSPVAFPSAREIKQAEEVLLPREPRHRNWFPGSESVDDLKVENLVHAVPMSVDQ